MSRRLSLTTREITRAPAVASHSHLRLAIVGLGAWGKNYLRLFSARPDVRVSALVDPREEARIAACNMVPADGFASLHDVPNDAFDGVVIASPSDTHAQLAAQALATGRHVLVEKPLAKRLSEAVRVASAPGADSRLLVGHLTVYTPTFRWLQQLAEAGTIGTARHVATNRTSSGASRNGDDVLWALGPHDVLGAVRLIRRPVLQVRAKPLADGAGLTVDLRCDGGATAALRFARSPKAERTLTIHATRGEAYADEVTGATSLRLDTVATHGALPSSRTPLEEQCDAFLETIRSGSPPPCGVSEAVGVVSILAAAEHSLRYSGTWVSPGTTAAAAFPEPTGPSVPP
jgi:UDP-N-acetylglucosamine 3-dehydrogenase